MPRAGTAAQRGYGAAHRREREEWRPRVEAGLVACWRCAERIQPGAPWDLGHRDGGPGYAGPEHQDCNRRAGAEVRNRAHPEPTASPWWEPAHAD